jgi:hypothetical protein
MNLWTVDISFADGKVIQKVYRAHDCWIAIDMALAEYPDATGAGTTPNEGANWYQSGTRSTITVV